MAIPVEANSRSPYAGLTQILRSMLGELYDDSPHDLRDEAAMNMARLQIIAPPSAPEREAIAEVVPGDLRDWYEHTLLNHGGRSSGPGSMEHGGVEVNFNDLYAGIEARVRDDNIDRTTVQDLIESRGLDDPDGPQPGINDRIAEQRAGGVTGETEDGSPSPVAEGGGRSEVPGSAPGGGDTWSEQAANDPTPPDAGTARQIPGGEQLWHVDGKVYLAYRNPRHPELWLTWHVENPDRLKAIYGDDVPAFDKELTQQQYESLSPWEGGLSAEIQNTSEDPWTQFNSDFQKAAERRPWLNDPSMVATIAGAYLEGRDPTQDELAETDWWNDHTAEERAFMENAVTAGKAQLREELRAEARTWLGPEFGNMSNEQIDRWANRVHADPGQGDDFLRLLKKQRKALFPEYEDEELTYEDIVTPFRNLASNVWGQPVDDESMLVDLANTQDYTEAATRLRKTGRERGVEKVWNDMFGALGQTEVGNRVQRSSL